MGELYLRLACQYAPRAVLPFLQSSDAYRIEAMLPLTHQHSVHDAEAFLLERLGDVQAALDLVCASVKQSSQELVEAVLQGRLLPDALPAVQRTSGAVSVVQVVSG